MHDFRKPVINIKNSGVGFPGLLTLLFIGLRLGGVIFWSWLWILSPIWISAALGLVLFASVFALGLVFAAMDTPKKKP
jgi:hypothetical protein